MQFRTAAEAARGALGSGALAFAAEDLRQDLDFRLRCELASFAPEHVTVGEALVYTLCACYSVFEDRYRFGVT